MTIYRPQRSSRSVVICFRIFLLLCMQMKNAKPVNEFYADSRQSWREWLRKNGTRESRVWLLIYKKNSGVPSLTYAEAVEEALCFGWIDSKPNKRDDKSYVQLFARRNPKSGWSLVNKQRVKKLIAEKQMTKKGLEVIDLAKKNGAWNALNEVSKLTIPADLKSAFASNEKAAKHFHAFPPSTKKAILDWIRQAKKTETREKRIKETVSMAEMNKRANQYVGPGKRDSK